MPGIVGIIGAVDPQASQCALKEMAATLHHSPTQSSGSRWFDEHKSGVGWVSHKGAYSDCMPVWNKNRDICLVFTGEHFARGASAGSLMTDAASLADSYEVLGERFLSELNGTFSGILIDARSGRQRIVLFNDRYGLGRIYFHKSERGFFFASEAKALLKVLPHLRRINYRSFGELVGCGCVLQNRTLFEGISLLPPAASWQWTAGSSTACEGSYFQGAEWEAHDPLSTDAFYEKLKATFNEVTPRYVQSSQAVGLSVTGGVDSRMVIAALRNVSSGMKSYTFGGIYRECADVSIGRQVAVASGLAHEVISLTPAFLKEFTELAARCVYLTDGAMDASGAVSLFVHRRAKEVAPVRLTGNYGGEILRGISPLKMNPVDTTAFSTEFRSAVSECEKTLALERKVPRASFIAFKQVPWHHYARLAVEQSQLTIRTPFLDNDLVPLAYQRPADLRLNKVLAYRYITDASPALSAIPTDRGTVFDTGVRHDGLAYKTRRWFEELLPRAEYAYDYGMPNWLAKVDRVLTPLHLERMFLGLQKYYHFRLWYRFELASQIKDVLLDKKTLERPYLNRPRVEAIVRNHTNGSENHTLAIHKLLTCELLQRHLIESVGDS